MRNEIFPRHEYKNDRLTELEKLNIRLILRMEEKNPILQIIKRSIQRFLHFIIPLLPYS